MRQSISAQSDLNQVSILVQSLQKNCFNVLTEEIINELNMTNLVVGSKCIDEIKESCVVQPTT